MRKKISGPPSVGKKIAGPPSVRAVYAILVTNINSDCYAIDESNYYEKTINLISLSFYHLYTDVKPLENRYTV